MKSIRKMVLADGFLNVVESEINDIQKNNLIEAMVNIQGFEKVANCYILQTKNFLLIHEFE